MDGALGDVLYKGVGSPMCPRQAPSAKDQSIGGRTCTAWCRQCKKVLKIGQVEINGLMIHDATLHKPVLKGKEREHIVAKDI